MTPLAIAAFNGQVEAVKVLVKAGADKTVETQFGTALKVVQNFVKDEAKLRELVALLQ